MSFRKHICIHPGWNHVCICDRQKDHPGRDRTGLWQCQSLDPADNPPPLFDIGTFR